MTEWRSSQNARASKLERTRAHYDKSPLHVEAVLSNATARATNWGSCRHLVLTSRRSGRSRWAAHAPKRCPLRSDPTAGSCCVPPLCSRKYFPSAVSLVQLCSLTEPLLGNIHFLSQLHLSRCRRKWGAACVYYREDGCLCVPYFCHLPALFARPGTIQRWKV